MYGLALSVVLVLIVIYWMTCAFGMDLSKMSSENNPITWFTNKIARDASAVTESVVSGAAAGLEDVDQPFSIGKTEPSGVTIDELSSLEGYAGQTGNVSQQSVYDPREMGILKKKEVESHYRNLKERSPYSTVGTAPPVAYERDDDPYTRESGVPWVGGLPNRAFAKAIGGGGPQSGARETTGASSESIAALQRMSARAPKWNG